MTVIQAENSEMKGKVYYTLTLFTKGKRCGDDYRNIFWRQGNAKRILKKLSQTGLYRSIILRKNEIWLRDATNEYSCSTPIAVWEEGYYEL